MRTYIQAYDFRPDLSAMSRRLQEYFGGCSVKFKDNSSGEIVLRNSRKHFAIEYDKLEDEFKHHLTIC